MHVNESKLFFGKELLLVKVVTTKFIPEKHYVCPRMDIGRVDSNRENVA